MTSRAKRGSMEPLVLPSESVQKLIALAHHAIMLEKWLREVKADGECMRQLMRWQIETFGNPYGEGMP